MCLLNKYRNDANESVGIKSQVLVMLMTNGLLR
jgi:hypothetical protein